MDSPLRSRPRFPVALLVAGALLAPAASAQAPTPPGLAIAPTPIGQKQEVAEAADFDHDGRPDLAIAHYQGGVRVALGDGAGGFGTAGAFTIVPTMAAADHLRAADLTGDGRVDLLVFTWNDSGPIHKIALHAALPAGGFAAPVYLEIPLWSGWVGDVRAGDVDGDGLCDVVTSNRSVTGSSLAYFRNLGPAGFAGPVAIPTGAPYGLISLDLADTNQDGVLDAVAVGGASSVAWEFRGNGSGLAPPTTVPIGANPVLVELGDVSGDGLPDLVAARAASGGPILEPGSISIRRALGSGAFAPAQTFLLPTQFPTFHSIRVADFNHDGNADVVYDEKLTGLGGLLGHPGSFTGVLFWSTAAAGNGLVLLDFDADGDADALIPNASSTSATLATNLLAPPAGTTLFGAGTPGCAGTLGLACASVPKVGNATFGVVASGAPPAALGLLLVGDAASLAGSDPFGLGCLLHVDVPSSSFVLGVDAASDECGFALAKLSIPNLPALAGQAFAAQFLGIESAAAGGGCGPSPFELVSSRGLAFLVQP